MKVARQVTMFAKRCGWSLQRHVNFLRARLTDCSAERRTSPRSNRHFFGSYRKRLEIVPIVVQKDGCEKQYDTGERLRSGDLTAGRLHSTPFQGLSQDSPIFRECPAETVVRQEQDEATTRRFAPNGRLHRTSIDNSSDFPPRAFDSLRTSQLRSSITGFTSGPIAFALEYARLAVDVTGLRQQSTPFSKGSASSLETSPELLIYDLYATPFNPEPVGLRLKCTGNGPSGQLHCAVINCSQDVPH